MKIFISCSKRFFGEVATIKESLEEMGHFVTPPNGYNDPDSEGLIRRLDRASYTQWKASMIMKNSELVASSDAVLVVNLSDGKQKNYIGGATFLEIFKAFELGKKIFLYGPIPKGSFQEELIGMQPIVLDHELKNIK